jgi:hypothetical protein
MQPQIVAPDYGRHNADLAASVERLAKSGSYEDLSTIIVVPCLGSIPAKVVQSWMNLIPAMNQKCTRIFAVGMEVGDAYSRTIEAILQNEELSKWKFLLTLEADNIPPPNGVHLLYESINGKVDGQKYDAVGGLYWTKGDMGQPMIYGDPKVMPRNFIPQKPIPNAVQPCQGLGMGFTLFRMEMFKDQRIKRPLFRTCQDYTPGVGAKVYTQDLYFFENAGSLGYKFASDNRCLVGHYDMANDVCW